MPEVSIFPAFAAGAMIAARVDVPEAITAHKLKALAGHEKTAYVFARLNPHPYDKKCKCHACDRTPDGDWKKPGWSRQAPRPLYVRFDIGARNVRLNVKGGEHFVVVAACDVDEWLAELAERDRRGMLLALPLTIERTSTREVSDDERKPTS